MILTNNTNSEFVFKPTYILAPAGTLEIDNAVYASDIELRETVNRLVDGTDISYSGEPVGFPDWTDLTEPAPLANYMRAGRRGSARYIL